MADRHSTARWAAMKSVLAVMYEWGEPIHRNDILILCEPLNHSTVQSYLSTFSLARLIGLQGRCLWALTDHGKAVVEGREETYLDPEVWKRRSELAGARRTNVGARSTRVAAMDPRLDEAEEEIPPSDEDFSFFVADTYFDDRPFDNCRVDITTISECFEDPLEAQANVNQWLTEYPEIFPNTWGGDRSERASKKDRLDLREWWERNTTDAWATKEAS